MKKVKIILISTVLLNLIFIILSVLTKEAEAKEKRKILLLQIIEENWDNLEFIPPKYKRNPRCKPLTKREVMERKLFNVNMIGTKKGMIKGFNLHYEVSKDYIPKNLKVYVTHAIKYFGKTDELKDDDILEEGIYRFGRIPFTYYYEEIPEKISLLTEQRTWTIYHTRISTEKNGWRPTCWDKCKHIRLVEDISILSVDKLGNLKIKYDGKTYNLKVGEKVEFPMKEMTIRKQEIQLWTNKFQEKVIKRWGERAIIGWGCDERSIVTNENLWFKTRVTIINYGYGEVEL